MMMMIVHLYSLHFQRLSVIYRLGLKLSLSILFRLPYFILKIATRAAKPRFHATFGNSLNQYMGISLRQSRLDSKMT